MQCQPQDRALRGCQTTGKAVGRGGVQYTTAVLLQSSWRFCSTINSPAHAYTAAAATVVAIVFQRCARTANALHTQVSVEKLVLYGAVLCNIAGVVVVTITQSEQRNL